MLERVVDYLQANGAIMLLVYGCPAVDVVSLVHFRLHLIHPLGNLRK